MNLESLVKLIRQYPVVTGVVFAAGLSAGGYLLYVEQCHAQTKTNQQVIADMLKWQQGERIRQEMELKMAEQARLKVVELCLSGKLKDQEECAKARVKPE